MAVTYITSKRKQRMAHPPLPPHRRKESMSEASSSIDKLSFQASERRLCQSDIKISHPFVKGH